MFGATATDDKLGAESDDHTGYAMTDRSLPPLPPHSTALSTAAGAAASGAAAPDAAAASGLDTLPPAPRPAPTVPETPAPGITTAAPATDVALDSGPRWQPQPLAAALIGTLVAEALKRLPFAQDLAKRLRDDTGTRLIDWVDHIVVPAGGDLTERLGNSGFVHRPRRGGTAAFVHPGARLPPVIIGPDAVMRLALKVEFVADFCAVHGISAPIEGQPMAPYRRVLAATGDRAELWVVERRGYDGFQVADIDPRYPLDCLRALEKFRARRRRWNDDADGFDHVEELVANAVIAVGTDMACALFFAAEREYWQRRNRAARWQKDRQDALGMGWANHDHHTYRSSRKHFRRLVEILEALGLACRERFHPGANAGWGAQVLEQPVTGIVVFADVDMDAAEITQDFAHLGLEGTGPLRTVGLWCALHGEAFLDAGMHHLECTFDHTALTTQLEAAGLRTMQPFTDLPYLRQSFTAGERWPVRRDRVLKLLAAEHIDPRQARIFLDEGVIGSHLENLERNDGYKGFNQRGIDDIISRTDPRRA